MSDVWASYLYQASFAGLPLDILETADSIARAVARRVFPGRDGGSLQDQGAEPRSTSCRIIFAELAPLDSGATGNHLERFAAFYATTQAGKAQEFVHPITGSYRAMVEDIDFRASGEQRDVIEVDCTFVEDTTRPARFDPGSLLPLDAGAAAVAVRSAEVDAEIAALGLEGSTVAADAGAAVETWESDPTISVREVNLQLASLTAQIDDLIATYELTTDVSRFTLWRRLQALSYSLRRAASLFRQSQPQIIQITLAVARPLRSIVAETYGASEASARYADAMRLNDIDDPSLIPAGTTLRLPSPKAARQASLRRAA